MSARYPVPDVRALPGGLHRAHTEIKRSRFIASVGHAASVPEARAFVAAISGEFPNATHNCWAFAVGAPGDTARVGFSDAGEPHGTAGRPMLHLLLHGGVGEIVCVVTRYFGGVKLGAGGLVRAYQGAVRAALEDLPVRERIVPACLRVIVDYPHVAQVRRLFASFAAQVQEEDFAADASFTLCLPEERVAELCAAVVEISGGCALLERLPGTMENHSGTVSRDSGGENPPAS